MEMSNNRAKKRIRYNDIPWPSQINHSFYKEIQWEKYERNINFGDLTWAERELYGWILDNILDNIEEINKQKWECIDLDKRKYLIEIIKRLMDENWMKLQDIQEYRQRYFMDEIIDKLEFPEKFRISRSMEELREAIELIETLNYCKNNEEYEKNISSKKKEGTSIKYIEKEIQNFTEKMKKKAKEMNQKEEGKLKNELEERIKRRRPDAHIEQLLEKEKLLKGQIMDIVRIEIPNIKEATLFGDEELLKIKIEDRIKNKKKRDQLWDSIRELVDERQRVLDKIDGLMCEEELLMSLDEMEMYD